MDDRRTPRSIAIVHNTRVPFPFGRNSTAVVECIPSFMGASLPSDYTFAVVDLANFDLPEDAAADGEERNPVQQQAISSWQEEISRHDAFVFVFPFHVWARTQPFKVALSYLAPPSMNRKPALVAPFGKEDDRPWELKQERPGHVPRKSTDMMQEFLREKGFVMVPSSGRTPEFTFLTDIWDTTNEWTIRIFPGGLQEEVWEAPAWNPCTFAAKEIAGILEGRIKR